MKEKKSATPTSQFLLYKANNGKTRVEVRFEGETIWLSLNQISELFDRDKSVISKHISNIFEEEELEENRTVAKFATVRREGQREIERQIEFYNLEVIIAVGYRVKSPQGTRFRNWATERLNEYIIKGFTMDDERLKSGKNIGRDYFDELIKRIRDIRASERRFYQKITDIYATSIDYDSKATITQEFYATVQNKLHWAILGQTAAEIVHARADASQKNMGLTTWKNAPDGAIRKDDIAIAKNYLNEDEIKALNRVVVMYLDHAEEQAERHEPMYMKDWINLLDDFLKFTRKNILTHAGKISHKMALNHANKEFEKYEINRRKLEANEPTSDFDKIVKLIEDKKK